MDSSSSDERGSPMNNEGTKICHRHTNEQIQRLEAYFKECPHPEDSQRRKLGQELNLKPRQIKFWFQNKRTQVKTQSEKSNNSSLRMENLRIKRENEAMRAAVKNVLCPPCGGPRFGREERERNLQKLRLDNVLLKQEYERLSSLVARNGGQARSSISNNRPALYGTSLNYLLERPSLLRGPYTPQPINITQPIQLPNPVGPQNFRPQSQMENRVISETATKAVAEVIQVISIEEPIWIKSVIDGRLVIDNENYEKMFTRTSHFRSPNVRIESSKEVAVVPMDARNLVDMFSDTETWERLFPTIVNDCKTIKVLESMDIQTKSFTKVIYEQLHILSPLVPSREFMILRNCQQVEEDTWVIADVSYHLPNVDFKFKTQTCCKRPSGCLIQALPNGHSKVTWMEHVEVNDKVKTHRLYKDLICGGFGFGARRWIASLERICERLSLSSLSVFPATDYGGVVETMEGRKSVMNLGERMLKNFSLIVKMSEKLDFSQLSQTNNTGVRVSVRKNTVAGQPVGLIVSAGSSLSLPLPPLQVYNFLRNSELRHQWDVLCQGKPVSEVARFVTGTDHKNSVTILQPKSETETSEMMILQDGFIDALGGMVVYAPMDLNTSYAAVSGKVDPSRIQILPSGFIISRDALPSVTDQLDGGNDNCKTILTIAFQILVNGPVYTTGPMNMEESTATVNTLISSTSQRIKTMLNCEDAQ